MSEETTLDKYVDSTSEKGTEQRESRFWGEIPERWKLVDGTDVYEVNPNLKPDEEPNTYIEMDALDTELPWPRYFGKRNASEYSGKTFTAEDTLFARITPCTENGKAALVPEMDTKIGIGSTEYAVLSPETQQINPWYLYYIGKSHPVHNYAVSRMRGSTGRQRVPFSVFRRELDIALPPLEEQNQISTVLQNIDKAIQKTEEIVKQTLKVKKGLSQELFRDGLGSTGKKKTWFGEVPEHWDVVEFSELIESSRNGVYKKEDEYGGDTPILKMGDMFGDITFDGAEMERVEMNEDETNKYQLKSGDLLFARRSLNIEGAGECTLIADLDEPTVFESSLIRVRLKNNVDPMFYAQYFEGPIGSKSIERIVTTTTASGIAGGDLKNLPVPNPPEDVQKEIGSKLSLYDERVSLAKKERKSLKRLKRGLLQDLLLGNVRTADTNIAVPDEIAQHG